jgi:hypothetical protein
MFGWHSGIAGCDAVTFGVCFLKFLGNVLPSYSAVDPRRLEASFSNQFKKFGLYVNN